MSYNKTIGAFFFASVNITVLGLTNPDVNLKRMHQLYIAKLILFSADLSAFLNMKRIYIKLGKEGKCHIPIQLVHSFWITSEFNNTRTVMFTEGNHCSQVDKF